MSKLFLEVDTVIDTGWGGQFAFYQECMPMPFTEFFDEIICEADTKALEVWQAIQKHDQIFMDTSFVGDSGVLLLTMLQMGAEHNIRDKKVINFRKYFDVAWHLDEDHRVLMKQLRENNNIEFIFRDDEEFSDYFPYTRLL